jgi:hypothetical protein
VTGYVRARPRIFPLLIAVAEKKILKEGGGEKKKLPHIEKPSLQIRGRARTSPPTCVCPGIGVGGRNALGLETRYCTGR